MIAGLLTGIVWCRKKKIPFGAMADVHKLIEVLQRLVDAGNTVLVIEHNLDVIKVADHIIDLGPEGGSGGGQLVACGTPEQIAACPESFTGQYLKKMLK